MLSAVLRNARETITNIHKMNRRKRSEVIRSMVIWKPSPDRCTFSVTLNTVVHTMPAYIKNNKHHDWTESHFAPNVSNCTLSVHFGNHSAHDSSSPSLISKDVLQLWPHQLGFCATKATWPRTLWCVYYSLCFFLGICAGQGRFIQRF